MDLSRLCAFFDRPGPRRIAAAVLLALVLAGAAVSVRRALDGSSEYRGFRNLSRTAVIDGEDVYEAIRHRRGYPPFFAVVFLPFSVGPNWLGAALFALVNAGATLLSPWLCLRAALARRPRFGEYLLFFLVMAPLLGNVMLRMESDLLILLAVSGGLVLLVSRDRPFAAGGLFALAAVSKALPAFLGCYLLVKREWKAAAGMMAGGLLLLLGLGGVAFGVPGPTGVVERHRRWVEVVVAPVGGGGADEFVKQPWRAINQSLAAAAHRWLGSPDLTERRGREYVQVAHLPEDTVRTIVRGLQALLLAGFVALWWGKGAREAPALRTAGLGSALLAILWLSDVSLTGHHATLVVAWAGVFAVLVDAGTPPRDRRLVRAGTVLSLLLALACVVEPMKAMSFLFFSTVVLFATLAHVLFHHRRRGVEDPRPPD